MKNVAVLARKRVKNAFLLFSSSVLESRNLHRYWESLFTLVEKECDCFAVITTCMVEIFIFPAVLIGVSSTVRKTGILQLSQSHLLASQNSTEGADQQNHFNKICSFSRKKKDCRKKNKALRILPLFPVNALLSVVHKCLNYCDINGQHCQR